jgi:hypothetical protein
MKTQIAIRKSQNEIYADSEDDNGINLKSGTVCAAHMRGILRSATL